MTCRHQILLKSGIWIPCGKCPSCLANLRQEWIFRLKQEFADSLFAVFVTLTYDDEHIPLDYSVNKKDVQDFHKRLRKHFPSGDLRFYLVSEYGDHTFRPHYHGLYFFKHNYDHTFIYDVFTKSWKNGFLKFGEVEEGSIVYCTKYCLKHTTTPPGCKPTFRLMSKMDGGLGSAYLKKMSSWHIDTDQFSFVAANGLRTRMPKYFRDKLFLVSKVGQSDLERYEKEIEQYQKKKDEFRSKFRAFKREHHYEDADEEQFQFIKYLNKCYENQDALVLKHCKKQNKF